MALNEADTAAGPTQGLREAVEALADGLALFDREDRLVFCNARFASFSEGLADLLRPGLPWSIFVEENRRRLKTDALDQIEAHLQIGSSEPFAVDADLPSGLSVRIGVQPTASDGFVLTMRDITETRRLAVAQLESEAALATFIQAAPVNMLVYDLHSEHILHWTPAWEAIFGQPQGVRSIWVDPAGRADYLTEIMASGAVDGLEAAFRRKDGTIFPGRLQARMVVSGPQRIAIVVIHDLTQLYEQRDELERQKEAAFQVEKLSALGQLLAGVAHELNNPLSVLVGQALLLQEEVDDPQALRRIEMVSASAERCAKIVKTFLAMARQKPASLAAEDLNAIIRAAVEVGGYGLRRAGASIDLELADGLRPVFADTDQIVQVLVNLLLNAEHALRDRQGARVVLRSSADRNGAFGVVTVSDNGPGVPDAVRGRIFEPFFTTKKLGEGTGIGLALSHRVAESHGGRLALAQSDGGAEFVLSLPFAPGQARGLEKAGKRNAATPLTVLLVEDDANVAEMIADILRRDGMLVTTCEQAEAAWDKLSGAADFDVILSDLRMPGMGGRAFYDKLKMFFPALSRRVIFLTGDTMGEDAAAVARETERPMLEKPVAPQDLCAAVRRIAAGTRR